MARRWRWAVIVAAVLVGLPLLACVLLLVLGNTDRGRRLIEAATEHFSHGRVVLQGLGGRFPSHLRLERLEIRDPQGTWLDAEQIQLDWSPLPMLGKNLKASYLHAARVAMERRPHYPPSVPPRPFHGLWLHSLRIDAIQIERGELGAALVGNRVALRLQGSADVHSWEQAQAQLTAQRLDEVAAVYRASTHLDGTHVQGQLDVEEDAEGPMAHLIRLPDLGALAVHLQIDGPRAAVKTQLSANGGPLQAKINGTVDLLERSAALQVALDAPAMSPRADLSWRSLSLHGYWNGTLAAPVTSAQLTATNLAQGMVHLDALRATLSGEGSALSLHSSLTGLQLPTSSGGSVLAQAPVQLHAEAYLADAQRPVFFTLSHPLLTVSNGRWNIGGPASASATVNDLAPLASLVKLELKGRGALQLKLYGQSPSRRLDVLGDLQITGGQPPLTRLLGPQTRFNATLAFKDTGTEIERAQLNAPKAQVSVRGRALPSALDLNFKAALPELAALSPALGGTLSGTGELQGPASRLTLTAEIDGKISAHGTSPGPIHLSLRAHDLPQRPNGRVDLGGQLDASPLRLTASLARENDGMLTARIEHGEWKSARLSGSLRIDPASGAPQGRLDLKWAHLEDLNHLTASSLHGEVDASVAFARERARSVAQLSVEAHDVGLATQQLQQLQVHGDIIDPLHHPVLALQVAAQTLRAGTTAKLTAEVRGAVMTPRLRLSGTVQSAAMPAMQLESMAELDLERRELQLHALHVDYRDQKLRLQHTTTIAFGNGIVLSPLQLAIADTELQASGRLTPTLALKASVHNFTPERLRFLWPDVGAEGHADAEVDLSGSLDKPQGQVRLRARGLRPSNGAARGLPATDIDASAQLTPQGAQVDVQMRAGDGLRLTATGQAPLGRDTPMDMKVSGSFNLNAANPIIEASGQRLLGQAKVDAEFEGTIAAPQAHGSLVLSNGDFQDYPRGAHLSDINMTVSGAGEQVKLEKFSAQAGGGMVTASGTLGLGAGEWPVALEITAKGAKPLASDLLTAVFDMDLKVSGGIRSQLKVSGGTQIDHADINIPNALPPNVAVLKVVRPGQAPAPPPPEHRLVAALDLNVDAPRAVFVRGRGVNAEVGGKLHIGGTTAAPDVSGGFDLRNGTVNMGGTSLNFTTGRVSFNGSGVRHRIDPTLDLTASSTVAGATATLNVGGYADAPTITLSSTPEMPQDEILSRLLFGVSVTQLTPLQLAQIGAALASIGGIGGGVNPINAVQRALGLDRLAISGGSSGSAAAAGVPATETSNAATIEAGRYVSRRVFVGAKQSTAGVTQAEVQIDLTRSLKLQSTVGTGGGTVQGATPQNDPGNSVGLIYQFEY
ncbi:MAG TPA: translocation/assembly module TamB domain-containing protein [Steroidobacteraceae bacterium]